VIEQLLLTPPFAFLIYLGLAGLLSCVGRQLAAKSPSSPLQSSTYAGGERAPEDGALPGYANTFVIALFFAVLHVGVLLLASGGWSPLAVIYLAGLVLTLTALMIG
jgi:NADH:ubiquinone oxidoreductase subunit 3 (subunit A)